MKAELDEILTTSKPVMFILSPSAYAELKEELAIDILHELHRYKGIAIQVSETQEEDVSFK